MQQYILILFSLFLAHISYTKDYDASFFGIESNGKKLNTRAIQKAIDYIHEEGGGRLIFSVGKYISGSIYLKSDVTICLKEGAELIGSTDPLDYDLTEQWTAFIFSIGQNNIGIEGKGTIDGRGYDVSMNLINLIHKGIIKDSRFDNGRPYARLRPQNIYFKNCKNIKISDININNSASWNQQYDKCTNLLIENTSSDCKNYWNNDGIDIVDCDSVVVRGNFIDASDDGICLKSHDYNSFCNNIIIQNNIIRSSANAIKFGTYSYGGYKNIKILNNLVYDTYRSAITFSSMDGNFVENILVDSLKAINTGNAIFLRIGERVKGRKGVMKNITIKNVFVSIPENKPDKGYPYEGPIEHQPRNTSPVVICGLPDAKISNIFMENIELEYPGGADSNFANLPLHKLKNIPELPSKYPEFSMFKELPAWGFFIKHVDNIKLNNIKISCKKEDFRKAIVLDDVSDSTFRNIQISKNENTFINLKNHNNYVFLKDSKNIKIE